MRALRMAVFAMVFTALLAGTSFAQDRDHDGDRDRGRSYQSYGAQDHARRGWYQGRKNGWRNCNLPPGLARQQGCVPASGYGYAYPANRGSYQDNYYGNPGWRNYYGSRGNYNGHDRDDRWRNNSYRSRRYNQNTWGNTHERSRNSRGDRDHDGDRR